jgi:hypothetical protein
MISQIDIFNKFKRLCYYEKVNWGPILHAYILNLFVLKYLFSFMYIYDKFYKFSDGVGVVYI